MIQEEFVKRSPLRILEASVRGTMGAGILGVLAGRKGVGKTACLVQLAIDRLFQQKSVIHVSYAGRVDHILTWYEDIFRELARNMGSEFGRDLYEDIVKNRVIMNFSQEGMKTDYLLRSVEAMIVHGKLGVETVIVDGYNFIDSPAHDFEKFKDFARRMSKEVWFSASLKGEEPLFDDWGWPRELERFLETIDILITLSYRGSRVWLHVVKDQDYPPAGELAVSLDPTTLLMVRS